MGGRGLGMGAATQTSSASEQKEGQNYNFSAAHHNPLTYGHTLSADEMAIATNTMISSGE